jgi:hypothetical protein
MLTSKFFLVDCAAEFQIEVQSSEIWRLPELTHSLAKIVIGESHVPFFMRTADGHIYVTMIRNLFFLPEKGAECTSFTIEFFRARKRKSWRFRNDHLFHPKFWFGRYSTDHQIWRRFSGPFGVSFVYRSGTIDPILAPYEDYLVHKESGQWTKLFPYAYPTLLN